MSFEKDNRPIYILYGCNASKERSSMCSVGASTNFGTFCSMIGSSIFRGDMEYQGKSRLPGFRLLHHDYRNGSLQFSSLNYGYVERMEDGKLCAGTRRMEDEYDEKI